VINFILGLSEAYVGGVFFSIGIITSGFLVNDLVTIVSGFISLIGIVLSLIEK